MKLFSPSKLNLFFRVLSKREDGFHEIASLMQAITLGDTLLFEESEKDCLTCTDPKIPTDNRNFIHRARALFRTKTDFKTPIAIHAEKRIPAEGGFGGGSGNIATTLWALNQMSGKGVNEATLRQWAGELSSDAPFFFSTGTAYTTGRGEKVFSLPPLEKKTLYLAKPEGGLSTPLVYRHCEPNVNDIDPKRLLGHAIAGDLEGINDLEYAAFALRPDLWELKEGLINLGFETVAMTGSGTGFYCLGSVENPSLPGIQFWKTSYLSRGEKWYEPS
ncbi:MAG: 4-(cytidine 5'-diphospho)-2-C-methyl-D-erythritol kinase [Simkaniaceae bacterium]|nr:MAG: 4-(cytidine 5'-diphospho)-2-C-methyl-D-erythritol kinase [Simkaniaceae bacterium]